MFQTTFRATHTYVLQVGTKISNITRERYAVRGTYRILGGGEAGVAIIIGYMKPGGRTLGVSVEMDTAVSVRSSTSVGWYPPDRSSFVSVSRSPEVETVSIVTVDASSASFPALARILWSQGGDVRFLTIRSPKDVAVRFLERRRYNMKIRSTIRKKMTTPSTAPTIAGIFESEGDEDGAAGPIGDVGETAPDVSWDEVPSGTEDSAGLDNSEIGIATRGSHVDNSLLTTLLLCQRMMDGNKTMRTSERTIR